MAIHVRNMKELAKALQPTLLEMTDKVAEMVYETLNYFLWEYYKGYEPEFYRRSNDFLHSAVKISAEPYKNGARAAVFIDYDSMDDYVDATGYQVASWANEGSHGGFETNHHPHVWQDTINSTVNNEEFLKAALEYLKSKGFSVRM